MDHRKQAEALGMTWRQYRRAMATSAKRKSKKSERLRECVPVRGAR
jgi:hypothetical protein